MNLVYDMERIKRIGLRIAFYRKQRGLTQKMLAEKANLSTSYLSKIESSGTDVTFSLLSLYHIADALELDPYRLLMPINEDYLLFHDEKPSNKQRKSGSNKKRAEEDSHDAE